ncbi:perlucin-like [Haliotis asinina]|uniref:perlucin-like n=1 Tax=Haliotis asinina TaxID=109174 RepID=UPI003531D6E3
MVTRYILVILPFVFLPTIVAGIGCPNGWIRFEGSCYVYNSLDRTFIHSSSFCEELGGYLVEIQSEKESIFVTNFLNDLVVKNGVWLGGNDLMAEGHWVWDKSEMPFNYTNWNPSEPDQSSAGEQDCLSVWKRGNYQWADHYCNRPDLAAICERDFVGCTN